MMLSVVQFDSIVQFDQFDWPYLVDHVKRIEVSIVCKIEHDF